VEVVPEAAEIFAVAAAHGERGLRLRLAPRVFRRAVLFSRPPARLLCVIGVYGRNSAPEEMVGEGSDRRQEVFGLAELPAVHSVARLREPVADKAGVWPTGGLRRFNLD
jgi:hypothetical protein